MVLGEVGGTSFNLNISTIFDSEVQTLVLKGVSTDPSDPPPPLAPALVFKDVSNQINPFE